MKTKKAVLEYLNCSGFANDGFGHPIPRNGLNAVNAFVNDNKEEFTAFVNKVRDSELRIVLNELPFVRF